MADKLKKCPFCGGKVKIESIDNEYFYAVCESCSSSTSFGVVFEDGTARDATKSETITAWNKRTKSREVSKKRVVDKISQQLQNAGFEDASKWLDCKFEL